MNIKLKSCPFCGGQALLRVEEMEGVLVECSKCLNRTMSRSDLYKSSNAIRLVVESWNRRCDTESIVTNCRNCEYFGDDFCRLYSRAAKPDYYCSRAQRRKADEDNQ